MSDPIGPLLEPLLHDMGAVLVVILPLLFNAGIGVIAGSLVLAGASDIKKLV